MLSFEERVVRYMEWKGYRVDKGASEVNIVYVEGVDKSGAVNEDVLDYWNDRRLLIVWEMSKPRLLMNTLATTEPGYRATVSVQARWRGGAARIAFGQYTAWRMGYHKQNLSHPALVQCMAIPVCRDKNCDGKRTGDLVDSGIFGINQHGTSRSFSASLVGKWSEGCLVGKKWEEHLAFIRALERDWRYISDKHFVFTTTVINGDDLQRQFPLGARIT